jgi:hypothetical protein
VPPNVKCNCKRPFVIEKWKFDEIWPFQMNLDAYDPQNHLLPTNFLHFNIPNKKLVQGEVGQG